MRSNIGQHMIIGFEGTKPSDDLLDFIREEKIGGVILFERNWKSLKQLSYLIKKLQEAGEGKLFIGVDQEGGRVVRFPRPFTHFPSMAKLALMGEATAYKVAVAMGQELSAVGVNVNFAPVLDVATNTFNPVIGDRSFGSDPEIVSSFGALMIQGLLDANVMPCGKHFPGHGDTNIDSHLALPVLPHTRHRLDVCELVPFKKAIAAGVPAIMTAHILVPNLDSKWPASISRKITRGILRQELNFEGLTITDDLLMGGITSQMTLEYAALKSLKSGADMFLVSNNMTAQKKIVDALKRALDKGEIDNNIRSLKRISRLKDQFMDTSIERPSIKIIGCSDHHYLNASDV